MIRRFSLSALFVLSLTFALGCDRVFGLRLTDPARVTDLAAAELSLGSATLLWTQVANGGKTPADYLVFFGNPPAAWPAELGQGAVVRGTTVGDTLRYTLSDLSRATSYSAYVVSFRETADSLFLGPVSDMVSFTTEAGDPSEVSDLEATPLGANSIQVRWTEVDDGAGRPASYLLAYGKQPVNWTTAFSAATRVAGNSIGGLQATGISGLEENSTYEFRIATVRDSTGSLPRVVGQFSPSVTATTESQPVVTVTPFFSDNFDNGARTNANGFTWASTGTRVSVSTERPFAGTHSLRFRFGADTTNGDSSAEQRFNLGRYLSAYWVEFMLYVPANFVHRSDSPNNNKFFVTWRDTYSDVAGGTWRIGYEYRGTSGVSFLRPMSSRWDFNSWTDGGLNHLQNGAAFIGGTGPVKIGQWNRIRMQFQAASSRSAADGIMRMWVNDALYAEKTDGKFHNFLDTPTDAVLRNGYFLGWSNSGFTQETVFHIDNVRFYNADPGW